MTIQTMPQPAFERILAFFDEQMTTLAKTDPQRAAELTKLRKTLSATVKAGPNGVLITANLEHDDWGPVTVMQIDGARLGWHLEDGRAVYDHRR